MADEHPHHGEDGSDLPDREALRVLVRSICRRLGWEPSSDVVEDCVQEAALRLWELRRQMDALSGGERRAYVVRCVWFVMREQRRGEGRQTRLALALEDLRSAGGTPIDVPDAEAGDLASLVARTLVECSEREELVAALRRLPPRSREVLDLWLLHDLTDREIAARLGSTPAAIKKQRQRALAQVSEFALEWAACHAPEADPMDG